MPADTQRASKPRRLVALMVAIVAVSALVVVPAAVAVTTASVAALQNRMFDLAATEYESSVARLITNDIALPHISSSLDTGADLDAQPEAVITSTKQECADITRGLGAVQYGRQIAVPELPSLAAFDPVGLAARASARTLADFTKRLRDADAALSDLADFCERFPAISQVATAAQKEDAQLLTRLRATPAGSVQSGPGVGGGGCR